MKKSSDRHCGALVAILLSAVAVISACGSTSAGPTRSPVSSPTVSPSASPTPACPDRVFAAMTSDQRIGQLFHLGLAGDRLGPTEINLIQNDHIGSVWFVDTSTAGVAGIQAMQGAGFLRIPTAVVQGAMAPAALQSQAATWGQQLHSAGINFDFAPVMDVVPPGTDTQNQPIGALQREYGH